jgi:hypothetical protein
MEMLPLQGRISNNPVLEYKFLDIGLSKKKQKLLSLTPPSFQLGVGGQLKAGFITE